MPSPWPCMLDADATAHLEKLARAESVPRRRPRPRVERVRPSLLRMMEAWPQSPAFITGRRMDVLAANRLADALYPVVAARGNMVRSIFLDRESSCLLYAQYEKVASETVASLRASAGSDVDDPALIELVGELSVKSEVVPDPLGPPRRARQDLRREAGPPPPRRRAAPAPTRSSPSTAPKASSPPSTTRSQAARANAP